MSWTQILCPFHEEANPSAGFTETGGFNCFGCGVKGNLFRLLVEKLNLDEQSAARRYQEITGNRYETKQGQSSWFPSGGVSRAARDLEKGTGLFPPWFRKRSST